MTSLCDLVPSGPEFLALSPEAAAPHVAHVARSKSTDGVFNLDDVLTRVQGTGMACWHPTVYDDVAKAQLVEHVDAVLRYMVEQGQIVPCYTAGTAGNFRIIAAP